MALPTQPEVRTAAASENEEDVEPVRSRDEDLVEEGRIARAGGGIRNIPFLDQSVFYLGILLGLAALMWWAFR